MHNGEERILACFYCGCYITDEKPVITPYLGSLTDAWHYECFRRYCDKVAKMTEREV